MSYSTSQTDASSVDLSAAVQPRDISSGNGYFNFGTGYTLDFSGTDVQIVVNDQASQNVDENLTFTSSLTASSISNAYLYKQKLANTTGGELSANEITLDISADGYQTFVQDLWSQLLVTATGDNGVARAESLGDYVVGLSAWAVFGNYRAVAPIVNDQELTSFVDASSVTVAGPVAKQLVSVGANNIVDNGPMSFQKGDISSCPMGDVLTTMIKYHPDRFKKNDVSDYQPVPFMTGDVIEFTVTFENLKVVESVNPTEVYLKNRRELPYDSAIETTGYLCGGVHGAGSNKWVVGVKLSLL